MSMILSPSRQKIILTITPALLLSYIFFLNNPWNSDLIVPEMVFQDLQHGLLLSSWRFSDAFFVFPDWIIYLPLRYLLKNADYALWAYSFIFNCGIVFWFNKLFAFNGFKIFLLLMCYLLFNREWWVYQIPVHHGGALLVTLYLLPLITSTELYNKTQFISFLLLGALTTMSDLFFGVSTLLPLGIYVLYKFAQKKLTLETLKQRVSLGFLIILLTLFCEWLFVFSLKLPQHPGFASISAKKYLQAEHMWQFLEYIYSFKTKLLFFMITGYACFKSTKTKNNIQNQFFLISILVTIAFIFTFNLWLDLSNTRYLYMLMLVLIYYSIEGFVFIKQKSLKIFIFMSIGLVCYSTSQSLEYFNKSDAYLYEDHSVPTTKNTQCILQQIKNNNLTQTSGLSTYWQFKMLLIASHFQLKIKQVGANLQTFDWLNNKAWSSTSANFKYIVAEKFESAMVLERLKTFHVNVLKNEDCQYSQLFVLDKDYDFASIDHK